MRIQAANTYFTGTYSILNSNNGSSFPYAMKVDGLGNFGNRKSLFNFGKVTITEHMVTAKYGTKNELGLILAKNSVLMLRLIILHVVWSVICILHHIFENKGLFTHLLLQSNGIAPERS